MQNDNIDNHDILDDDIMQCRADILRNRKNAKDTDTTDIAAGPSEDTPVKRTDVTATRVNPFAAKKSDTANPAPAENKIRIPHFEELVASQDQVVETLWETPDKSEPKREPQIDREEIVDEIDHLQIQTPCPPKTGFDLDPENIVTAEEEQALFDDPETNDTEDDTQPLAETAEQGLDDLRKIIQQAQIQAQTEIDELEDVEELMTGDDIDHIPVEKDSDDTADIIDDAAETMNVTDLLATDQDRQDITARDIEQDCDDEITSAMPDDNDTENQPGPDTNIPKFDLAEKILKEQRQVASKRRQRPTAARNLTVMPIAGTVGRIIEQAKKAVADAVEKNEFQPEEGADQTTNESIISIETVSNEPVEFDTMEVVDIVREHTEPELSVAACRIINESDRLNPFQEDIIVDIVSKDIARFCGELTANC